MTFSDTDSEIQRIRYEVRRFRQHFVTYVAVIGVLFIVNALTGGFWFGHWWFFWIALIWGVILALEGAHLFGEDIGREWEDRMVDQVLARRRRQAAGASHGTYKPPMPPSAGPASSYGSPPNSPAPPYPAVSSETVPASPSDIQPDKPPHLA
ncbi:MAG: 2TM domain-containing protein [Alphaproteobacteria bacterium]|nr:2TM domain-containing protein [Alphaproteobacteria bacterium]